VKEIIKVWQGLRESGLSTKVEEGKNDLEKRVTRYTHFFFVKYKTHGQIG